MAATNLNKIKELITQDRVINKDHKSFLKSVQAFVEEKIRQLDNEDADRWGRFPS